VFLTQATTLPDKVARIPFTVASEEPTLKVPGLVTVKAPLLNVQLSAVDPFMISMSAVVAPKVTALTVILPSAVKSVVAARTGTANRNAKQEKIKAVFLSKIFIIILIILIALYGN
jgi:hypothetical protein